MGKEIVKKLGASILSILARAGRSIRDDFKAGGMKKVAWNKYFLVVFGLSLLTVIGSVMGEKAGTLSTIPSLSGKVASINDYGDVPSDFLKSRVVVRQVLDYPEDFTVEVFIKNFLKVSYSDGRHPKLGKWHKSNNVYSIPFINEKGENVKLVFQHDLSEQSKGKLSFFKLEMPNGELSSENDAAIIIAYYNLTRNTFESSQDTIVSFINDYGDVSKDFIKSRIITTDKDEYPEDLTVEKFIKIIATKKNNDGTHAKFGKFENKGNIYTISVTGDSLLNMMEVAKFVFEYDQDGKSNGNYSIFKYQNIRGKMSTSSQAASLIYGLNLTK